LRAAHKHSFIEDGGKIAEWLKAAMLIHFHHELIKTVTGFVDQKIAIKFQRFQSQRVARGRKHFGGNSSMNR
jgi:hypothetical protein